ncbi:hypothetical protein [Metabacillus fastidiosus]|uniref:hypothetical protein n=1 Tax=Metabacillus fastidiosus TaxID=1458 RepID=UPI002E24598C|nr:hypothetical protein [Metabacillus fastidiosus]
MKPIYLNIILFIGVYAILVFWDYYDHNIFNWLENLVQSLFFVILIIFINWLIDDKKQGNN